MPGTTVSPRVRRFAPPTPPHGLPCFVRQLHRCYHRIGPLFNVHPPISISPTLRRPRPWRWALKRSPRSRQDMYIRPWGLRHRGPVRPLIITMTNILPSTAPIISATRTTHLSLLNIPGHLRRYRHFTSTLTSDRARLAEICAWFLLHITGLPPAMSLPVSLAYRCSMSLATRTATDASRLPSRVATHGSQKYVLGCSFILRDFHPLYLAS